MALLHSQMRHHMINIFPILKFSCKVSHIICIYLDTGFKSSPIHKKKKKKKKKKTAGQNLKSGFAEYITSEIYDSGSRLNICIDAEYVSDNLLINFLPLMSCA